MVEAIWVFNGAASQFPSGVFSSKEIAEEWITKHNLTGVLTKYPVDIGVYEWAIQNGFFTPVEEREKTPRFIQRFSSSNQEHYHYEDGKG